MGTEKTKKGKEEEEEEEEPVMEAAQTTTYQSDCRLLKSILFALSTVINVTSNQVRLLRKENGWTNLVQLGGMELLARFTFQTTVFNEGGAPAAATTTTTAASSLHAVPNKQMRRARSLCRSLLEILISLSSSCACSLVSTGAILIVLSEGTLMTRRVLSSIHAVGYVNDEDVKSFYSSMSSASMTISERVLRWTDDDSSLVEWPIGIVEHLIEYMICTGMWTEMSELIHQSAASKGGLLSETRQSLLQHCMELMETTVVRLYAGSGGRSASGSGSSGSGNCNCMEIPALVHEALAQTGIKSLLHLVEALAESQKVSDSKTTTCLGRKKSKTAPQFNRYVGSPIPFVGTALQSLRIMLNIAEHNINVLHTAASDTGIQNELYHVFAYLLEWCALEIKVENDEISQLLEHTIIMMGYYARGSTERQQSLHWGSHPTPLQRLCNLPFRFFSQEKDKNILFPTLISICHQDVRNRSVVEDEISKEMLYEFIDSRMKGDEDDAAHESFLIRFPKKLWKEALDFFMEV